MRHLTAIALLLALSGGAVTAQAQGMTVQLGGPLFECRPGWDFAAGSVQAHFSAGRLAGLASQPPRFEVDDRCGQSSLTITLSSYVKNIQMRVGAGSFAAHVLGGGSVNPGGSGTIITVPGPTSTIDIWSTGNGRVVVDQISFELAEPPALFSFGATTTGRVLTHKYRSDDAYPSPLQTEDGKIRVEGLVHDLAASAGIGGRKVYFRLIDPPDTADYVVRAGDAHVGDNADGPGKLNGASTATATSDSSGKVSVTLEITDHAAGDNYQVEAGLDENFTCSPAPCQKSIVYTAWKRVYVEVNKMYRRSAFLTKKVVPGAKTLEVSDVRPFPNPPFDVVLVHGPAPGSGSSTFSSETVRIVSRTRAPFFNLGPFPGKLQLDPDPAIPGVSGSYDGPLPVGTPPKVRAYLADAAAYVTGNRSNDFYLIDGRLVNPAFEKAFVEHVWFSDAGPSDSDLSPSQPRLPHDGVVPYVPLIKVVDDSQREWMTRKWSHHVVRAPDTTLTATPNHHTLFTATRLEKLDFQVTTYAETTAASGWNDLWLYLDSIGSAVEREAIVHELAHEWRVNHAIPTVISGGHCDKELGVVQKMALRPASNCSMTDNMYADPDAGDGVVGFHYWKPPGGGPVHSEYMQIRHRAEPIPQNDVVRPNPQ